MSSSRTYLLLLEFDRVEALVMRLETLLLDHLCVLRAEERNVVGEERVCECVVVSCDPLVEDLERFVPHLERAEHTDAKLARLDVRHVEREDLSAVVDHTAVHPYAATMASTLSAP